MDIYFSVSLGPGGHFICFYDVECCVINRVVRHHAAVVWLSLAEAEEFALEQGWHPVSNEMSRRLHDQDRRQNDRPQIEHGP